MTIAGALLSFGVMYPLCVRFGAGASPAILAVALSIGLGRRAGRLDARELLIKLVTLPLVALGAGAVGLSFLTSPILGATLFAAGIVLSIWLRNFGPSGAGAGRLVALPFIVMLVVPVDVDVSGGKTIAAAFVLADGAIALLSSALISLLATRAGFLSEASPEQPKALPRQTQRNGLPVATRMALQMLVALALAFGIGMLVLPAHWSWVVLSAFIVCSGAIGRGDAIYRGILRFGGAAAGTFAAALLELAPRNGAADGVLIFALLFAGLALREVNYAYWAACITLVFALLQGGQPGSVFALFALRLAGIAVGALCAIAATWFVFPIRTEQVVRRRVADALAAVRVLMADEGARPWHARHALLDHHAQQLERVAPPVRLHRRLFGAKPSGDHPAAWIELAHELLALARSESTGRAQLGAKMRSLGSLLRGEKD